MMIRTNRVSVDGTNVRFWLDQEDAEEAAKTLAYIVKSVANTPRQYEAKFAKDLGWYVKGNGAYHDADGKLPRGFDLEALLPVG